MTPAEYQEVGRRPDGSIMLRVRLLSLIANAAGIQFKVGGFPYGASFERAVNHAPRREGRIDACAGLRQKFDVEIVAVDRR